MDLIGGQMGTPYLNLNLNFALIGNKCIALIGGQIGSPYWGTNVQPLLGDKCVMINKIQCLLLGIPSSVESCCQHPPLFGDKWVAIIGRQMGSRCWGTNG